MNSIILRKISELVQSQQLFIKLDIKDSLFCRYSSLDDQR